MRKKLLLVDGHELLFRMFCGMPFRVPGKNVFSVHGVIGFVSCILRAVDFFKPDYLLVVFDGEADSARYEEMDGYKGNRILDYSGVADEDNPFTQLGDIFRALDYLGVKYCEADGFEADDIVAGYVRKFRKDFDIFVMSRDSDFFQLIGDSVSVVYSVKGGFDVVDSDKVFDKFGVEPSKVADIKALVGDKTDNIDGVFGVGTKTASRLFGEFGDVENLLENLDRVFPLSLRKKIEDGIDVVRRNISLVRLDRDVDLFFGLEDLRVGDFGGAKTMDVLKGCGVL